jgi:hypothetical protein
MLTVCWYRADIKIFSRVNQSMVKNFVLFSRIESFNNIVLIKILTKEVVNNTLIRNGRIQLSKKGFTQIEPNAFAEMKKDVKSM